MDAYRVCLLSLKCYYHLMGRYEQWKVQLQEEREREREREGERKREIVRDGEVKRERL